MRHALEAQWLTVPCVRVDTSPSQPLWRVTTIAPQITMLMLLLVLVFSAMKRVPLVMEQAIRAA